MENVLVVGINTRSVACSLSKLDYNVLSVDYFGTVDNQKCSSRYESILKQKAFTSCGHFSNNFHLSKLENLSSEFVDLADFIVCLAGTSPDKFPRKKILGNKDTQEIDNKYKLYQKLKDEFTIPLNFLLSDIKEAVEIAKNYPNKDFIIKPVQGSGGSGIIDLILDEEKFENLDYKSYNKNDSTDFILQERVDGRNISASVLSNSNEFKTILTSEQIIGSADLGQREPYGYCGNIAPLLNDKEAAATSEQVIDYLSLSGSNGVDFILNNDGLFLIEVNPRLQGTLECAELALGINVMEAHLQACLQDHLMEIPPPGKFAVKMIVHARKRSLTGNLFMQGIHDVPKENVIIEKGEPVATALSSSSVLEDAIYSAGNLVEGVYGSLQHFRL